MLRTFLVLELREGRRVFQQLRLDGKPDQQTIRERKPCLCFEALAASTGTDWNAGRGELNKAVALIRDQMPDVEDDLLADEIKLRAKMYRGVMPNMMLTPTALAKHWKRLVEITRPAVRKDAPCGTCDDLHLVCVDESGQETWAPCPDCGPKL